MRRRDINKKEYLRLGDLLDRYGLDRESRLYIESKKDGILIHTPLSELKRIYLEPTNSCNLNCRTCIRHTWDEEFGFMEYRLFEKFLVDSGNSLKGREIFFGGLGEPLSHPEIVRMVRESKKHGAWVELISNGVLLDKAMAQALIEAGLDMLWVSIDGASPESYKDVRLGNELPHIIENLKTFRTLRYWSFTKGPKLGIAFVAMKRNIGDLPALVSLSRQLGADAINISNVLPYTEELGDEILFSRSLHKMMNVQSRISLPRMDGSPEVVEAFQKVASESDWLGFPEAGEMQSEDACPFIQRSSVSIRWDGKVSPCPALLYDHEYYLDETLRRIKSFFVGDLEYSSLIDIWNGREYVQLRDKIRSFDFSPCTICNSCDLVESNLEDCFGNSQPCCGGCLWAQGFIRCP